MTRRKIQMHYHYEPEGWWSESPELPGFSAAGATFEEVRQQAHEGAAFFADEPLDIEDRAPMVTGVNNVCSAAANVRLDAWLTIGEETTHSTAALIPAMRSLVEKVIQSPRMHVELSE